MRAFFLGFAALVAAVGACSSSGDGMTTMAGSTPAPGSDPVSTTPPTTTPKSATDGAVDPDAGDAVDAPADTGPTVYVTYTQKTMTVAGHERTYWLGTPVALDRSKTYPVVMMFHGNPGTVASLMQSQPFESVSLGDAIIVYPQALSASGDVEGAYNWDHSVSTSNVDIPFIDALPSELATTQGLPVDASRVFGYGYSGGAFFVESYECLEGGGVFRALTSNAGGVPGGGGTTCSSCSAQTVPTLLIHGQADTLTGDGRYEAECQAASSGCTTSLTDTTPAPCQTYAGCRSVVERCSIPGVAHNPPWTESLPTAWAFFQAH